jgi:serine/threonine protein kinase
MAVVYRAELSGPSGFSKPVVIKRVRPEFATDPHFTRMLLDEARLSARLIHPGIVQVLECGELDGEVFVALEFIDGVDLLKLIRHCVLHDRSIPPGVCVSIVSDLAAALGYAHQATDANGMALGIVHRDVSPANAMITRAGGVKLLDFGVAKATRAIRDEQTRTGAVKGKLSYMSPEQADGRPVDRRSDIFALGILLFELLTRTRLFHNDNELATLRLVREAQIPSLSELAPNLPAGLGAVLTRMLARNVEERFSTCEELVSALSPFCESERGALARFLDQLGPIESAPPQTVRLLAPTAELPVENEAPVASVPVTRRSFPRAWGIGLLGLTAVIGGGWMLHQRQSEPPPPPPPMVIRVSELPVTPEPVVAPPAKVKLVVLGRSGARVLLEGIDVGTVPYRGELAARADSRLLRVELNGFVPLQRKLKGDQDFEIDASLVPVARKKTSRPAKPAGQLSDPFREGG